MALTKEIKSKLLKDFGANEQDSGSVAVQVALLTERINELTGHLKENAKDFSSKRGLLSMIGRRNKILDYIERSVYQLYKDITKRLNLILHSIHHR